MSKPEKKARVPAVRFPEFQNLGEWEEKILGDVCNMQAGKFVSASEIKDETADGFYPCYGGNGLRGFTKTFTHNGKYSLIGRQGALCGNITLATDQFHATEHAVVVTPNKGVSTLWLYYMLIYLNLNQFATGQAQPGLSVENLDKVALNISSKEDEQQKIADCLSSIDDLITAQTQKLAALKAHKKGLMQQLFPAEGETVPKLRFPEFRDGGEWMCEELSKCLEKVIDYRGKAPPKSESGIPLITAKNVRLGWLDMSCDEYIEADEYENWMTKGVPKTGDILFTTEAPLGNVALFPNTGKFALGQRIITLRTKTKKCLSVFLFQSLLGSRMQNEIDFHSTGSTAKGIKSSVFVGISFCYPEIPEQQKIADCLSSIDGLITAQSQKIEALKLHKKGLMQQLFPAVDNHPTPSGHPSTGGELRQHHSPPVEGWQAQPDGVVSPTAEDS